MYPTNPEALYRLVQLEHEHRIKRTDRSREHRAAMERER
jgi:hypothetical protein